MLALLCGCTGNTALPKGSRSQAEAAPEEAAEGGVLRGTGLHSARASRIPEDRNSCVWRRFSNAVRLEAIVSGGGVSSWGEGRCVGSRWGTRWDVDDSNVFGAKVFDQGPTGSYSEGRGIAETGFAGRPAFGGVVFLEVEEATADVVGLEGCGVAFEAVDPFTAFPVNPFCGPVFLSSSPCFAAKHISSTCRMNA